MKKIVSQLPVHKLRCIVYLASIPAIITSLTMMSHRVMAAPTSSIASSPSFLAMNLPEWTIGPFVRPTGINPLLSPNPKSVFTDPVSQQSVHWEALHTFNPAAVVRDGKVYVLYRAEDDSGTMAIGQHTSRLGMAVSEDGLHFTRQPAPVFYPANDDQKDNEAGGGCEDPRIVEAPDGTYVLTYTQWNRRTFRAGVATSKDLVHWTKHGPAFANAYNGKYANLGFKSCGILTRQDKDKGRLIAAKINGKYWMYWGEGDIHLATSQDLINWQPVEDAGGKLVSLLSPRRGKFDSGLAEVGPPPVVTDRGIVLLYNGKNNSDDGAPDLGRDAYAAGQALFDINDPGKLVARLDEPFYKPQLPFEMRGQYTGGTTFVEGLVNFKDKWFLYYGCADSLVGVAVYDKKGGVVPEPIPVAVAVPIPATPAVVPGPKNHPLIAAGILTEGKFGLGTPLQGVRRIVVVGDSITQGGDGPKGYVGLLRAYLSKVAPGQFRVSNAGISGNKTTDLIARFNKDVLQQKPDLITINIGVNDVWHGFDAEHPQGGGPKAVALDQYRSNLDQLVKDAQAQGAVVALITPTGVYEDQDGPQNAMLAGYIDAMREVAQKNNCLFVNLRQPFETFIDLYRTTSDTDNLLTVDGVHMNDWGNRFMAATILTALTSPAPAGVKLHPPTVPDTRTDLALHKTVMVSSTESNETNKDFVVDGDISTRWASAPTNNEWLTVDLGTPQHIGKVHLEWEAAFAKAYKIQVSDDGQTWRDVVHVTDGQVGDVTHSFAPTTARFVRVMGEQRGTTFGYSLWEVNVYAPGAR